MHKDDQKLSMLMIGAAALVILGGLGVFIANNIKFGQSKPITVLQKDPFRVQESGLKVRDTFPDFSVNEVGGSIITRDSLKGKPTIVWFTTSWCVPCQIGAQDVSKLDDKLGGKTFDVLVIFVDLKEKPEDLELWRKKFARDDWMVAFDNELTKLAARINLKFLDSKFLLDKNGIIKNIHFQIVDEDYLNTIRQVVKEN